MKLLKFYVLFLVGAVLFLGVTAYRTSNMSSKSGLKWNSETIYANETSASKDKEVKRDIKFNHALHVKDQGMKCEDCHGDARKSGNAKDNLNPAKKDCATCHDVTDPKNCNFCHTKDVSGKTPVMDKKAKQSDRELYFSHKFHLTYSPKVECTTCHMDLDKVKLASESPVAFPPMQSCYSCHDQQEATKNCEACHTNLTNLKPKDHLRSNFLNEHKMVQDLSRGLNTSNNCMMCHSDNFCQACHTPLDFTGKNEPHDFSAPFYTKETGVRTDREALQKLNNVHDMNYLYTHGLDANHKGFECKTCHDPVEFCSACHQNGGNTLTGLLPSSHVQPNFTTLGVNTGGGLHSTLAKRDIESCQSCHSVEGGDPVCVRCHFDNDGVRGTNPKTHDFGFRRDEKGLWHDTPGAVCYTCHTDANARPNGISGVGFCGYCHGGTTNR